MTDRVLLDESDWNGITPSSPTSALRSVRVMEAAKTRARGDLDDLCEFSMQKHAQSDDPIFSTFQP